MTGHVLDRLSAYLDHELSVNETATVREHLSGCEACAERLSHLAAVDRVVRDLPTEAPPRYFDSFAARVRTRIETSARPRARFRISVWSWAVAAAVLVAVVLPRLPKAPGPEAASMKEARAVLPPATAPAPPVRSDAPTPAPAAEIDRLRDLGYGQPQAEGQARAKAEAAPRTPGGGAGALQLKPEAPSFALPPPAAAPPSLATPPARARVEQERSPSAERAKKTDGFAAGKPAEAREESLAEAADASVAEEARAQAVGAASAALDKDKRQDGGARVAEGEKAVPQPGGNAEAKLLRRAPIAATPAAPSAAAEYRALEAQATGTPLAVRRDGWRDFASRHPEDPRADEARVRVVALGVDLALETGAEADQARARKDALDYLARKDASQKERVRALLDRLTP